MADTLFEQVWKRAAGECEYCRLPQRCSVLPHAVDHVVARFHHGATILNNLCLACALCNAYKGTNLAGIDPDSGVLTRLFNAREDRWAEHFRWHGAILIRRTAVGRTTVDVLHINERSRVDARATRVAAGQLRLGG